MRQLLKNRVEGSPQTTPVLVIDHDNIRGEQHYREVALSCVTQQTVDRLTSLRLHGLRQGYEEQLNSGDVAHLGFDDRFGLLVERQWLLREERRTNKLLKSAQPKQPACVEDVEVRQFPWPRP